MKGVRHYVRIDAATEQALEEVCRFYISTKSAKMRQYIMEGVRRDAEDIAQKLNEIQKNTNTMVRY